MNAQQYTDSHRQTPWPAHDYEVYLDLADYETTSPSDRDDGEDAS